MILLATDKETLAAHWRQTLSDDYQIYDIAITDRRNLEACLKRISLELLLVDKQLFGETGIHEISDITTEHPDMQVIVFTQAFDQREEIASILFGAKAYCPYDVSDNLLLKIVKAVLSDEVWVDRKFITRLLHEIEDITKQHHSEAQDLDKGIASLTPRETQIADLVANGASNRKIAEQLNISERTVKAHLGVIFRKINIQDRLQLALFINRHRQIGSIWHLDDDQH